MGPPRPTRGIAKLLLSPQRLRVYSPGGLFQAAQEQEQQPRRDTGRDSGVGYRSITLRGATEFPNGVFNIRC